MNASDRASAAAVLLRACLWRGCGASRRTCSSPPFTYARALEQSAAQYAGQTKESGSKQHQIARLRDSAAGERAQDREGLGGNRPLGFEALRRATGRVAADSGVLIPINGVAFAGDGILQDRPVGAVIQGWPGKAGGLLADVITVLVEGAAGRGKGNDLIEVDRAPSDSRLDCQLGGFQGVAGHQPCTEGKAGDRTCPGGDGEGVPDPEAEVDGPGVRVAVNWTVFVDRARDRWQRDDAGQCNQR